MAPCATTPGRSARRCVRPPAGPIRPAHAIVDPNGDIQVYNAHTTAVPIEFHGLFLPA